MEWIAFILSIMTLAFVIAIFRDHKDQHRTERESDRNETYRRCVADWKLRVQLNETRERVGLYPIKTYRPLPEESDDQKEFLREIAEGRS